LPDVTLPDADGSARSHVFQGKWTLVYVGNGHCDADCRNTLVFMRQTRLSLNNEMTRVQRVLLASTDCCDREYLAANHAGLLALDASEAVAQPLLAQFPPGRAQALYVVDPLGNLMMRYDARLPPKGLLEDLKRLLQLSHIG
jgi:cytochrome oxidase Cu insertion factor (SCO1/SenC/PrrC family)